MAKIPLSKTPVGAFEDKTLVFPETKTTTCLACGSLYAYIITALSKTNAGVKCPNCGVPHGSKVIPKSSPIDILDDEWDPHDWPPIPLTEPEVLSFEPQDQDPHWPSEEEKGWDPDQWHPNHPDSFVPGPPELHYVAGQLKPVIPINLPAGMATLGPIPAIVRRDRRSSLAPVP